MKSKKYKKKILVTAAGGYIGKNICRIIRKDFPDFFILGTDSKKFKFSSKLLNEFYHIKPATSKKYINDLNNIIKNFNIDLVIPNNEDELIEIVKNSKKINLKKFIFPGNDVVKLGYDKLITMKILSTYKIDVPWTFETNKNLPKSLPCIAKKRTGVGARNVNIISSSNDVKKFSKKNNFIFQELLKPKNEEITCAIYRSIKGNVRILSLRRKLKNGVTTYAKVIKNVQIDKLCRKIAINSNLQGSMNVQLILTKNGPRIFEINPRFSSTVYMRDLMGFSDLTWSIKDILGIATYCPKIEKNLIAYKIKDRIILRRKI
jgi:carbamoyl-phosphate synthase large subunit